MHNFDPARPDLPNFHVVGPELYRGGQPTAEGFESLKRKGIKTVICLREEASAIEQERALIESLAMEFVSIPLRPMEIPAKKDLSRFLEIAANQDHHPAFVHCLHGMDRTGLVVGLYRMKEHDWPFDKTFDEMVELGFHVMFENLKTPLTEFARQWGKLDQRT